MAGSTGLLRRWSCALAVGMTLLDGVAAPVPRFERPPTPPESPAATSGHVHVHVEAPQVQYVVEHIPAPKLPRSTGFQLPARAARAAAPAQSGATKEGAVTDERVAPLHARGERKP
jgi:hypothetical protein